VRGVLLRRGGCGGTATVFGGRRAPEGLVPVPNAACPGGPRGL
jgi:hypothetical protein